MANEIKFVRTSRGGRKAVVNGFLYTKHRTGPDGWTQWHCVRRETCKGRIRICPAETNYAEVNDHDHVPSFGEAKAAIAVAGLKRRAEEQLHTPPSLITQETVANADSETTLALPKESTLKKQVQRIRSRNLPPLPTCLVQIEALPPRYTSIDGEQWLIYDSRGAGEEDSRVLVFGRRRTIRDMSRSQVWLMDGTFKSRPLITAQLYVIHYMQDGHVLPGVYTLMASRSEAAYGSLFEAIQEQLPAARSTGPAHFSTDFELAAAVAFKNIFTNSTEAFCFFHFSQSLWRKMQECGAAADYLREDNEELRAQFHAIPALPFVPTANVPAAYVELREHADERLDEVLDLLEDYYILGRRRGRGRTAPRYPPASWNAYQRTLDGINRTNNSSEAWNRRWNTIVGKKHPNIYAFLDTLKEEDRYAEARRRAVDLGQPPPLKRRRYRQNDDRLLSLTRRYNDIAEEDDPEELDVWKKGVLKYLRLIGHSARGIFDQ